jgi:hypothetical protein
MFLLYYNKETRTQTTLRKKLFRSVNIPQRDSNPELWYTIHLPCNSFSGCNACHLRLKYWTCLTWGAPRNNESSGFWPDNRDWWAIICVRETRNSLSLSPTETVLNSPRNGITAADLQEVLRHVMQTWYHLPNPINWPIHYIHSFLNWLVTWHVIN